jgi:signal transduction histidine kinase/DNA-binding response OmpR family regulator
MAALYRDSLYNEKERIQWAALQSQYDTEKAQDQISILESENEVKNLKIRQNRIVLITLAVLVAVIIFTALFYIRQRRKRADQERLIAEQELLHKLELEKVEADKLKELDRMKSHFFANISHEFRTPLTLIMRPIEKVLSKTKDEKDKKDLNVAQRYARSLQNLINNLLTLSRLESGKMQLRASEINIVKLIRGYFQAFESLAMHKNITLEFTAEVEEINAYIDQEKFEQILNNLLSNAFKFTPKGGQVTVKVSSQQSAVSSQITDEQITNTADSQLRTADLLANCTVISITDTGPGIEQEHLNHIFDRFYRVEDTDSTYSEGTGIGLALTKELVELHHGEIHVESEVGKGTTFRIYLPLGRDHLKEEEMVGEDERRSKVEEEKRRMRAEENVILRSRKATKEPLAKDKKVKEGEAQPETTEQPLLLIAEDNDDMRLYIREYFEDDFQIIEAVNGLDGYEKAIEKIPDIVISDVMMPRMDGNEFCQRLKEDERTSHIPVILLTARASRESKIEGLETGADDFITKPFDGEELQVRVKNLLEQRKKIREFLERKIRRSRTAFHVDFSDSGITSMDEQFLQKAMDILRGQHSDPEFNAQKFSPAIGLSIAQLNRKIKALTGQTTGDFIRTFRLLRAAELLKKKSATISEIAYDVGFNSPSYFTECFHEHFGITPSEYVEKS